MNNVFSHRRFFSLLLKDAADLRPKFIRLLLVSSGIGLITFLLANFVFNAVGVEQYDNIRIGIGIFAVLCITLFAPFQLYKHFNHRTMGVSCFMLPASQLEKWLSMFIYCLIVTPLLSVLTLTLVDICLLPVHPKGVTLWFLSDIARTIFRHIGDPRVPYLTIVGAQALLFLCNIWFQDSKVRKVFAVIIIIIIVDTTLSRLFFDKSFIENELGVGSTEAAFIINLGRAYTSMGFWHTVKYFLTALIPIGLWYASFLKWKEQEL